MRNTKSNLPLTGVKVIDFGQYIAGPAVAMLLGDLGATVVHIDPPDGPMWDSPANAALMRNKMIVTLDLKSEEGLAQARALCAEADIIVEKPSLLNKVLGSLNKMLGFSPKPNILFDDKV